MGLKAEQEAEWDKEPIDPEPFSTWEDDDDDWYHDEPEEEQEPEVELAPTFTLDELEEAATLITELDTK